VRASSPAPSARRFRDFPLSQYHYERGFIDLIVPRGELKKRLSFLLKTHAPAQGGRA